MNITREIRDIVCSSLNILPEQIENIEVLKTGMTNNSFSFCVNTKKYIMRIPGVGTEKLINRKQEAAVYKELEGKGICDPVYYINPKNGYKISEFIQDSRVCDAFSEDDISKCMVKLRGFHQLNLTVDHNFDLFGMIDFYEKLWAGCKPSYIDYYQTKNNVFKLREYIEQNKATYCLCHIDAVPDNCLFTKTSEGTEEVRLIDWEYAGMQDPHLDIAMFCIYAGYSKDQCDHLIDLYFENKCNRTTRIKIYCYIAAAGLLWSNWCEYKKSLGVEFGEYATNQYGYAKDFFEYAKEMGVLENA